MTQVAYSNDPECVSLDCRRQEDWTNLVGLTATKGGCRGWHCANCKEPSNQYGHMQRDDTFRCEAAAK